MCFCKGEISFYTVCDYCRYDNDVTIMLRDRIKHLRSKMRNILIFLVHVLLLPFI